MDEITLMDMDTAKQVFHPGAESSRLLKNPHAAQFGALSVIDADEQQV